MVRFFSLLRSSLSQLLLPSSRDRKRNAFRNTIIQDTFLNRPKSHRALLESLEPRHLMAAVPIANNDTAYYTDITTDLVVTTSSTPAHLLANDLDIDGGSITSSLVSNPTSGTIIAFGTNGTFTYRPNTGFTGIDSFTYKTHDGSLDSNLATVTIAVGTKLLAGQNLDNKTSINSQLTTGNLSLIEQVTPEHSLVYRSDSLSKPIITVDTQLAPGVSVPTATPAIVHWSRLAVILIHSRAKRASSVISQRLDCSRASSTPMPTRLVSPTPIATAILSPTSLSQLRTHLVGSRISITHPAKSAASRTTQDARRRSPSVAGISPATH